MTTLRVEGESYFHIDNEYYNEEIHKMVLSILPRFDRMVKSYFYFNVIFFSLIVAEVILLILCFSYLIQATILAFSLAALFLTIFSFFILRIYFQARKPEVFEDFQLRYSRGCKNMIQYREGIPEHYVAMANAYSKLAALLKDREYTYFVPPKWLRSVVLSIEKFSSWFFWEDVFGMREHLLQCAVEEHVKLVKCEPTSLDIHAALANAYVMLSSLYLDPRKMDNYDSDRWIPQSKYTEDLEEKFRVTSQKAIEEFKILNDYAPNDPWVHTQLAYSYHDLQMPKEEIDQYETILKLRSDDKETLFKLGCLYFQQGRNADGLRIYEQLKQSNFKKAEQLITHYGTDK